jgi:hypothetical protein
MIDSQYARVFLYQVTGFQGDLRGLGHGGRVPDARLCSQLATKPC